MTIELEAKKTLWKLYQPYITSQKSFLKETKVKTETQEKNISEDGKAKQESLLVGKASN